MTHWLVLIVATITWIVWIPACSFQALAEGRSGRVSVLPAFPLFPLAAWGLACAFQAAQWPMGTTLVGGAHVVLLIGMLASIVKSRRALRARHRDR